MEDSTNNNGYAFRSYIKNIYFELPNYKYRHSPLSDEEDFDTVFAGRERIFHRLLNILKEGKNNGAYLVTGFRGMGKTSFVKKVIQKYKEYIETTEGGTVCKIDISFAQFELKETDILRQITKKMLDESEKNTIVKLNRLFSLINVFRFFAFILSIYLIFNTSELYEITVESKEQKENSFLGTVSGFILLLTLTALCATYIFASIKTAIKEIDYWIKIGDSKHYNKILAIIPFLLLLLIPVSWYFFKPILISYALMKSDFFINFILKSAILACLYMGICLTLLFLIVLLVYALENRTYYFEEPNLNKRLQNIYDRCNISITKESGVESNLGALPFGFIQKKTRAYPIANAKEIEYELIEILKEYNKFENPKRKFLFVFDELDKVEPSIGKGYYQDDSKSLEEYEFAKSQLNELRNRKKIIINILASLKHFITEANARFIFIAGREMFDASLADIADRQSSISSIFHHIIYVDSFLKDREENYEKAVGLTDLVESYLSSILLPKNNNDKNLSFINRYYNLIKPENPKEIEDRMKAIFNLQNFIIYLTYRSNGSPKKLVRLIEEYIFNGSDIKPNNTRLIFTGNGQKIETDTDLTKKLFLGFNYNAQYKFGFIAYLYRPFILYYSQTIKKYSDNVLVSTPYLMDHLIKFHPFAFSVQNLELLPEVLSNNRNPILRHFIEELIYFLGQNHIRESEIGIFEYKFYNKTANEISYLSKIFEDESAAFNFTLDEAYFIKMYLRNKIKDLRNGYRDYFLENQHIRVIYSISFLNGLLGDAHYFDQEFDDAIIAYQDAIQSLGKVQDFTSGDEIVAWIKLKLRLGLVFEKMKSLDAAISCYNDTINETMSYLKLNSTSVKDKIFSNDEEIIQTVNQAYIASFYVYEKNIVGGVNKHTIIKYNKEFDNLAYKLTSKNDTYEFSLIKANYYHNIGTLLFYKNFNIGLGSKKIESRGGSIIKSLIENKFDTPDYDISSHSYNFLKPKIHKKETPKNKDYRFPFIAFLHYKKALLELLKYDYKKQEKTSDVESNLTGMFKILAENINSFENRYDKVYLKNIGFVLSKLGDTLLTGLMLKYSSKSEKIERINESEILTAITTAWKDLKSETNTLKFFDEQIENYFTNLSEENDLNTIIYIYLLAGRYYSKAGKSVSFGFQLKKVLHLFKNCVKINKKKNNTDTDSLLIKFLEEAILYQILEVSSWNTNATDRPQIYKYKSSFGKNSVFHSSETQKYIYANISNSPEVKEAILLFANIKIRSYDYGKVLSLNEINKVCPEINLISSNTTVSSQLTRIQEQELQHNINRRLLKEYINTKLTDKELKETFDNWEKEYFKIFKITDDKLWDDVVTKFTDEDKKKIRSLIKGLEKNENKDFLFEYTQLIANSIYSLTNIIQIIKMYDNNPYLSYSYLGHFHNHLGDWLKHYALCKEIWRRDEKNEKSIKSILDKLVGTQAMTSLVSTSQYQMALQCYHKAKEMHSNGPSYESIIKNMLYLEDDYNDSLYHFGLSLERQLINSYLTRSKIKDLEKETRESPLYKYSSFLG